MNDIVSKINEGVDEFNILAAENMTDTIYIDFNKTSPSQIITGDVNGDVIKWIRKNSHRYLAKKTDEGKMTICQLADGDGTVFAGDGSTAPPLTAHRVMSWCTFLVSFTAHSYFPPTSGKLISRRLRLRGMAGV